MKKLFTLLLFAFTVSSAMAIKVKQISLAEFGSGNTKYDSATQTFTPTSAWDGCQVWLGSYSTTGFGNIALELAAPSSKGVYFSVTYTDGTDQGATISAGNLKTTIALNKTTEIQKIEVKSSGDWAEGQTIQLESIYLLNEEVATTTNLWEGAKALGNWADEVNFNKGYFANWDLAKDKLRIAVTPSADAEIQLQNGKWNKIDGTDRYLTDETFVDYKLTQEMLDIINNVDDVSSAALRIKGKNCTVTRVDIISPYVNLDEAMNYGWGSASYDNTTPHQISFTPTGPTDWPTRGWEFSNAKDASGYNVLYCKCNADCNGLLKVVYGDESANEASFASGDTEIYLVLKTGKTVKQVLFTTNNEGTVRLNDVNFSYESVTKPIPQTHYASFSAPYPVTIPEGVAVGRASVKGNQIVVDYVDDEVTVIPANTGVILKGTGRCRLLPTTEKGDDWRFDADHGNQLVATSLYPTPNTNDGNYYYGLLKDEAAFAKINITSDTKFSGDKAYIKTSTQAQQARLVIFDEETTAVKGIETEATAMGKHLENGRLVIVKNGSKFNAAGQLVK